jgi:hypothetical protein
MMRKIFGGAMAFSMIGAVVLGGVLAWSNSQELDGSSVVGSITWAITTPGTGTDGPTGDYIGPDDDHVVWVDNRHILNTGAPGDFSLEFDPAASKVDITDVTDTPAGGANAPTDQNNCAVVWFGGTVEEIGNHSVQNPGDLIGQPFRIGMQVHPGAPTACMGDTVSWKATITVKTVAQ